jgi:hypothetical protein
MRAPRLTWLVLPVGFALACGGRYEKTIHDRTDDIGGSAAGGSSPSGGTGIGGSGAGVSTGGGCACDPIACGPGYKTVPKGCCWECVIDVQACEQQRQNYAEFRLEIISSQSMNPCMTAADCGIFEDRTGCSPDCGFVIPNSARRGIDDRLYAYAEMTCNPDCPSPSIPPCPPPAMPACVAGRCR